MNDRVVPPSPEVLADKIGERIEACFKNTRGRAVLLGVNDAAEVERNLRELAALRSEHAALTRALRDALDTLGMHTLSEDEDSGNYARLVRVERNQLVMRLSAALALPLASAVPQEGGERG